MSPSRFGFGAETDLRPALSEFAGSPSGCQRRFGLLSQVQDKVTFPRSAGRKAAHQSDIVIGNQIVADAAVAEDTDPTSFHRQKQNGQVPRAFGVGTGRRC